MPSDIALTGMIAASGAICGGVMAVLGKVFEFVGLRNAARRKVEVEDRDRVTKVYDELNTRLVGRVTELEKHVSSLHRDLMRALLDNEGLRSEVRSLQQAMLATRSGFSPMVAGIGADAFVVIDQEGTILQFSTAATLLMHWAESEIVGQSVTKLFPDRLVITKYLDLVRNGQLLPKTDQPLRRTAEGEPLAVLTKEGDEVLVEIQISYWSAGGRRFFAGRVTRLFEPRILTHDDAFSTNKTALPS